MPDSEAASALFDCVYSLYGWPPGRGVPSAGVWGLGPRERGSNAAEPLGGSAHSGAQFFLGVNL